MHIALQNTPQRKTRRLAAAAVAFAIAAAGCVNVAPLPARPVAPELYGTLNCGAIGSEYQQLVRVISDKAPYDGLPVALIGSGAKSPQELERALEVSEALHRIGHLRETHADKACTQALANSVSVEAAQRVEVTMGAELFASSCVSCHGPNARGDGWLARGLPHRVADLTTITLRNNGNFPAERLEEIIDGRHDIALHGPRDMPVWGRLFQTRAAVAYGRFVPESGIGRQARDAEIVALNVRALVRYLASIQK